MKYTEEMILQSPSGYCMPFEEEKNKEVTLSKGYGEQKDAVTGETSFHHGINFHASHRPLAAVASGVVSSIGTYFYYFSGGACGQSSGISVDK